MSEIVLQVNGMSCGHCVNAVETAMKEIGAEAQVDLASKKLLFNMTKQILMNKISLKQLKNKDTMLYVNSFILYVEEL